MSTVRKENQNGPNEGRLGDLTLVACPTGENDGDDTLSTPLGRYNPRYLAGQALSLASSLSPSYMEVYVNSLASYSGLKALAKKKD